MTQSRRMGFSGWFLLFSAISFIATAGPVPCSGWMLRYGASIDVANEKVVFRLRSLSAQSVELCLFADRHGKALLERKLQNSAGVWSTEVAFSDLAAAGLSSDPAKTALYYGYRLSGPNADDVDAEGNRFNPRKLVIDPYALELSHDPLSPGYEDETVYLSGPKFGAIDSSEAAPKGLVLPTVPATYSTIHRPFRDEIIFEAHLRGLTMADTRLPKQERGTYLAAGKKAKELRALGVTAIEFLPIHEFQNELNQVADPSRNNYWGYMPVSYFSPDRQYATPSSRKVPGGVIEEFRAMVQAFHAEGIKVYLDVVYNHTFEGGTHKDSDVAQILSFRGIDNAAYYQTIRGSGYKDNNGCGPNFNCAHPMVRDLILDSLAYYRSLGVDGFRFDLASVLGNVYADGDRFHFDKMPAENVLNRAIAELPARPADGGAGVDLIAEPWHLGEEAYQLGNFPYHPHRQAGWAEWNGSFRDIIRKSINRVGYDAPTPGMIAARVTGSADIFEADGRKPWHSVNKVTSHDGFTLYDLFSYNSPRNKQPPPYGPSDGGELHNNSWDQVVSGETPSQTEARRRQAARNAMALNLLSFGVPMILGGDEFLRSQNGNNNAYNIDSPGTWIDWSLKTTNRGFYTFTQNLIGFRKQNALLRPAEFRKGTDTNGNGVNDLAWYQADGSSAASVRYMDDGGQHFLAWRIDSVDPSLDKSLSVYIAYNWGTKEREVHLPSPRPGHHWYWQGDTSSSFESSGCFLPPGKSKQFKEKTYTLSARALAVFVEN